MPTKTVKPKGVKVTAAKKKSTMQVLARTKSPSFKMRPKFKEVDKGTMTFHIPKKAKLFNGSIALKTGSVQVEVARGVQPFASFSGVPQAPQNDSNWTCSIDKWKGEVHSVEPIIHNPNFTSMYPGAIYDYKSIADGSYKAVPFKRKPLDITIDGVHFSKRIENIANPNKGTVNQAVTNIVQSKLSQPGARTFGTLTRVSAEQDLYIKTGGSGYYLGFGGSHNIAYNEKQKSFKYLLEVFQSYYTVSTNDTLHSGKDFFVLKSESNDSNAIAEPFIDPNWVYVDSVTYGRILYVLFESDSDFSSFGIDVEAHASVGFAGGAANLSEKQKSALKNTSVKVVTIGGSPVYSAQILTSNSLAELNTKIDRFFEGINDEQMIAYTLRTLDNEIVGARMVTEFTSRSCHPKSTGYDLEWVSVRCGMDDDGGGEEFQGKVRIRAIDGNNNDIMDKDKVNKGVIDALKLPAAIRPSVWTFLKGNESQPVHLTTGEALSIGKKISFNVNPDDANAKLAIRTDVIEFDDFSDDNFTDGEWSKKFSELQDVEDINLTCSHDLSRISFKFRVTRLF